jgi:hypothetical protein
MEAAGLLVTAELFTVASQEPYLVSVKIGVSGESCQWQDDAAMLQE